MIKQFVPQKVCLKCQGCCRFQEAFTVWAPQDKKIRLIYSQKENIFFCSFFDKEKNKCRIFTRRPFECRLYPFLINRKDKKVFLAVDLNCHFAQENLRSTAFKEYTGYLTGLLNNRTYQRAFKNNPQIIQFYPQVLNLIELKL